MAKNNKTKTRSEEIGKIMVYIERDVHKVLAELKEKNELRTISSAIKVIMREAGYDI